MTIGQLKTNAVVHAYLRLVGVFLFLAAGIETALIVGPGTNAKLVPWGMAAMLASLWIIYRMDMYARYFRLRAKQAEARAKLHEHLDGVFERSLAKPMPGVHRKRAA